MNSSAFHVNDKDQEIWTIEVVPWHVVFNHSEPYNILTIDERPEPKQ